MVLHVDFTVGLWYFCKFVKDVAALLELIDWPESHYNVGMFFRVNFNVNAVRMAFYHSCSLFASSVISFQHLQ